jgi:CBS domain-containing protein
MLGEICKKPPVTVPPKAPVKEAARLMRDANVGCVIVSEASRPVGILTDRDIVVRVIAAGRDPARVKVEEIMEKEPAVIPEHRGLFDAMKLFGAEGIRRLPVVSATGDLVGIVTLDDVLMLLGREMGQVASAVARTQGPLCDYTSL